MNLMEFLDVVSYSPSITVFGKSKHKSTPGVIIGGLSLVTILALSIYFVIEFFGRWEITVIYNRTSSVNSPIDLRKTPFLLNLVNSFGEPIDPELYELRLDKWKQNITDGIIGNTITKNIPLEECDYKIFDSANYLDSFKKKNWTNWKCTPKENEDLTLEGRYGDLIKTQSFINIVVNMCNNKTTNNTCKSNAELESQLKNSYLIIVYLDNEIDYLNYTQPIKPYLRSDSFPINWDIHMRYFYNFKNVLYKTDEGFVFESKVEQESFAFSEYDQIVQIRQGSALYPNITIGTITLTRQGKSDSYLRSFPKIQTLLAKIGGVIQGINFSSMILSYICTKNFFLISILNNFFYFDKQNKNDNVLNVSSNIHNVNLNISTSLKNDEIENIVKNNNFISKAKVKIK